MNYLGNNIKYLRKKHGLSQAQLAEALGVKRSSLSGYELGNIEPNIEMLVALADHFQLSIDALVRYELEGLDKEAIKNKDLSGIKGSDIRILSTTVDKENRENIELVPHKAKAGYLSGYADPEFITELPRFNLPNLPTGTFRAFEIEGDSMLPMPGGSVIIGKYVENWQDIKDDHTYVLVTDSEGIVYKRVKNHVAENGTLELISDNPVYSPYPVDIREVREAWSYYAHLNFQQTGGNAMETLIRSIEELKEEIQVLRGVKG